MDYIVYGIEMEEGYIMHKDGRTHKYIAKLKKAGKTRYFYTMAELNEYKKALSSKDEHERLYKAMGDEKKAYNDRRELSRYGNKTIQPLVEQSKWQKDNYAKHPTEKNKKIAEETIKRNNKIVDKYNKEYEKADRKIDVKTRVTIERSKQYNEAKTLVGKAKAVNRVFNKYHPKTAKQISRGKKKMHDLLGKVAKTIAPKKPEVHYTTEIESSVKRY